MSHTTRLLVALPLISLSISGCIATSLLEGPTHQEVRTLTVAHVADSGLSVVSENGSISVTAFDGPEVRISARIKAVSEERLHAVEIIAKRTANNTLEVHAEWPAPGRKSNESCGFEIQIPDVVETRLQASNGRLQIERLSGQADLQTSNGSIVIRDHRGPAKARTSNGTIDVEDVSGNLELRSSNGKINVREADGQVKAQTSNGSVRVALAESSPGPIDARTTNGSVTLGLSQSFAGELIAQTSQGSIDVKDIPQMRLITSRRNFLHLGFGSGGPTSSARTNNGSITIRMNE